MLIKYAIMLPQSKTEVRVCSSTRGAVFVER